jgi:hypothetical protein
VRWLATGLLLTSINLGENIDGPVKRPVSLASKSSDVSSHRFKSAESMGFKGEFRQSK